MPDQAPVSVLLVDDDSRNLDVLESILASPSYNIVRTQTAGAALLSVMQQDFAAILLDIRMPDMSGFELARLIKQRKRNRHIPILFLTGYFQEDEDVLAGYTLGAVDYLTKPVNPHILRSKVAVFANLYRTTSALTAANARLENEMAERQQAELVRAQLAAIVEFSSDAIYGRTLDGHITSWNPAAEHMFGYTAEEIMGRSVSLLIPRGRRKEFALIQERIQRGETVEPFETVRLRKDGRTIEVSVTLSAIRDAAGRVAGVSAITRDVSERKWLQAAILEAGEREQRRISQDLHDGVGQLLAGISCLCNSLHKNLRDHGAPDAGDAARISELLIDAVAQTRGLARGLYPVAPDPQGLMSAFEGLAANITSLFKVPCRFVCRRPVLIADNVVATHLYRIAQEAANNALKHARPRLIEIKLAASPQRVLLTLADDGAGFTSNAVRGLGLRIMLYRADMIGGTLTIQPRAGGGTIVVCSLSLPHDGAPPA